MAGRERERDRDKDQLLLIPVAAERAAAAAAAGGHEEETSSLLPVGIVAAGSPPPLPVILLPIAITFYTTWWFIRVVDGFFSPIYIHLGINVFGLGFATSITFIFLAGVFMSSWLGASLLGLGELFIKKTPLVRHIYSASKQISAAISPDQSSRAFKEVVIIRHPRIGEYALGFITSTLTLRGVADGRGGGRELACVYVPTNNLYLGDIFLMSRADVIVPDLSVREAIEIVLSGGMSVPQIISAVEGVVGLGGHGRPFVIEAIYKPHYS
uniref:Protein LIKE COV 3 n=1 Tax=Oryza meridionalis TaxID=40149 RepID=A0A0E0FC80_9ORYZ